VQNNNAQTTPILRALLRNERSGTGVKGQANVSRIQKTESILTISYTIVILLCMKTAVSLPERLYKDAEKAAKSMGIPRSQLFAKALEEYISHHKRDEVTEKLNEIYKNDNIESNIEETGLESIRELTKNDAW